MKRLFTLSCFLLGLLSFSYGQWTYTTNFVADMGNPGGVNGDADASGQVGWSQLHPGSQSANAWSAATPLPFAFDYFGSPVTSFKVSLNGLLTFNTASATLPAGNNTNLPGAGLRGQKTGPYILIPLS